MSFPGVERPYSYFHRPLDGSKGWWVAATKDEWLTAVLHGFASPKPPPSWIAQQVAEGRSEKSAAIIWNRNYDRERKHLIWSMASDDDFREIGYR